MSMADTKPEVWLRGRVDDVPLLLQPVAHALLQVVEDAESAVRDFPDNLLWMKPAGAASAGFHLQHMAGVVDRLFTYAREETLSDDQRAYLQAEGVQRDVSARTLVARLATQVDTAIAQLRATDPNTMTEPRSVGRMALPSSVAGLLFHAAEHTQRHLGQLIVTVRVVRA
jgi:uncharacterized damage-inducible protein DinB